MDIVKHRRYKVLPLERSFTYVKDYWENCVEETKRISPVFNRNGYYFDRQTQKAWLEINGEAWLYGNYEYFQYELDHSKGNNRIHNDVYKALGVLLSYHLGDKRLWKLYLIENQMRILRSIYLNGRKSRFQILGR